MRHLNFWTHGLNNSLVAPENGREVLLGHRNPPVSARQGPKSAVIGFCDSENQMTPRPGLEGQKIICVALSIQPDNEAARQRLSDLNAGE